MLEEDKRHKLALPTEQINVLICTAKLVGLKVNRMHGQQYFLIVRDHRRKNPYYGFPGFVVDLRSESSIKALQDYIVKFTQES